MGGLVWIDVPHVPATFGIVLNDEGTKVVDAAPIGRWMIGKDALFVRDWVFSKRGVWWPQGHRKERA